MKKMTFCAAVAALAATFAFAEPTGAGSSDASLYRVDSATGRIYINEDLSSFSFDASGLGTGGSVEYAVYRNIGSAGDLDAREPTTGSVGTGGNVFESLKKGDSIGFIYRPSTGGSFSSELFLRSEADYVVQFGGEGGGSATIGNIKAVKAGPSGMPLPGLLAVLLVGGAGAGALKLRKHRT